MNFITIKDAFLKDIEIIIGYISMGMIFGILLKASGFGALWAAGMSIFIYSGVMQFLAISFFSSSFGLFNIFITTLVLNSRQSIYTLIMLPRYKKMDKKRFFNIFCLTDETFAIIQTKKPHKDSNPDLFVFFVSMFNYISWITGCVLGTFVNNIFRFNNEGLEFIMTAIFVVIFLDQWKASKEHITTIIGICVSVFFLLTIGAQYFLIISIIVCIIIFALLKNKIETKISILERKNG